MVVASICTTTTLPALAEDAADDDRSSKPLWSGSWQPPEADNRGWDWVRLTSDEWVKGEIIVMRDFHLKFDSDEFDVVEFDWDDVAEIVTERPYIVTLQDFETSHSGTITMTGDRVFINVGDRVETFARDDVLAITPSDSTEWNLWSGHLTAGVSFRSGNTDESELSGRARLTREGRRTRTGFEYIGTYGSLADKKNTNNHRGRTVFDYFLTRDLFLTPAAFEAFTDEFQNISYRLTPAVGLGYYLFRLPAFEWDVRLGGGYQHVRSESAVVGDDETADNGAVLFGTSIDADLTSRVDLILEYRLQVILPDTGQTNHHSEATVELEVTNSIDLDVSFVWDRIEDPQTESGGETPESDDFRLSIGLGIEF